MMNGSGAYQSACGLLGALVVLVLGRVRGICKLAQLVDFRLEQCDVLIEPSGTLFLKRVGCGRSVLFLCGL